jgi:eukaryotic-like serine/threonine-protein kinase
MFDASHGRPNADRNLLFGILALQMEFITREALIAAMYAWFLDKCKPLGEVLVEQRALRDDQRAALDVLVELHVECHQGDPAKSLASVADDVTRSLAGLADPDIERSLAGLPGANSRALDATVDPAPGPGQRYSRTRLHATGGIGRVWLARDADLGRNVALKELRPERADDQSLWTRFLNEAKITGQLEHPGIVPVYELAYHSDCQQPFYTMRFVKGRTLTEAARAYHRKRAADEADSLDFLKLLSAFVVICDTIAYAHSRGVIHRDLKGQNVVLGDFGEVVVLDWGLAKLVDTPDRDGPTPPLVLASDQTAAPDLTADGQTVGTPAFMAPEQAAGRLDRIDRRADVYGLGAILYEILTGQPPFAGASTLEVLRKVREEAPVLPRSIWPDVPSALEAICLRALAKTPSDRPAQASDLAQEVQGWQEFERRKVEEALRKQTEILQSVLNSMSDGVVVADESGKFLLFNPAAERFIGVGSTDAKPDEWTDTYGLFLPDKVTPCRTEDLPLVRAMRGEKVDDARLFIRNAQVPQGVFISVNSRPFESSAGGARGGVAAFRDITEHTMAVEALRESEERYRSVIAAMQDGIAILDAGGAIRACNSSAETILGLSADQMMGRTPRDPRWHAIQEDGSPFPEETRPPIITLRTGQPCRDVVVGIRKPDGALTWISVNSQPLFQADAATPSGVVVSFQDITERRKTDEALRRARADLARLRGPEKSA